MVFRWWADDGPFLDVYWELCQYVANFAQITCSHKKQQHEFLPTHYVHSKNFDNKDWCPGWSQFRINEIWQVF